VHRRFDWCLQLWLIVLDKQQIIAAAVADGLGPIAVREHGIAADQLALQGQDAQKSQGGFVFVGLGIDTPLPEYGRLVASEGRQHVNAGDFAVTAALERLAI
jgi:hypothetical protein